MGRGREGKGEGGSGREKDSREKGGKARLGYLSRGPEFLVTPLSAITMMSGRTGMANGTRLLETD